jgi:L-alanine-DL-glutamate epimerase-like enolase superfamily enzyme
MSSVKLNVSQLAIPFRTRFKHASAERKVSDSVWVEAVREGLRGRGEGCPRKYVTNETTAEALEWIESIRPEVERTVTDLAALRAWTEERSADIDLHPAAWCAVELALLELFAREASTSVEGLLGLRSLTGNFRYTAVLSDEGGLKFAALTTLYILKGFRDFKVKARGELRADAAKLRLFRALTSTLPGGVRLRMDGNNVWAGRLPEARAVLAQLNRIHPLFAVEEPLAPREGDELLRLSRDLNDLPIILDEGFCRPADVDLYPGDAKHWIGNIRISKMGGLLRSLATLEKMKARGWRAIVGAQVGETSVLTRAALTVAAAANEAGLLEAQEGAYGTLLLERDIVTPPLMFGKKGILAWDGAKAATTSGWSLD